MTKQKQKWDLKEVTYSNPQCWEGSRLRCKLRPRRWTVKGESVSLSSIIYISLKLWVSSDCIQEAFSDHSLWKAPCPLPLHYLFSSLCVFLRCSYLFDIRLARYAAHSSIEMTTPSYYLLNAQRTCSVVVHGRHLVSGSLLNKWRPSMMTEGNTEVQSTDSGATLLGFESQFFYVLAVWS